jgi:rhodanese-related sulfurtransferase
MKHIASMICVLLSGAAAAFAAEPAPTTTAAPADAAKPISQEALKSRVAEKEPGLVVLDVRTPAEFAAGHVPGARNVPHDEIPARLAELSSLKDQQVVLYCRSGRRTAIAAETLRGAGFDKLLHLEGDWLAWEAAKQPVER